MAAAKRSATSPWAGLREGDLVLVDTAPWIYVLEDHPDFAPRFVGLFEAAEEGRVQIAVSVISLAELLVGPLKEGREALAKRYEKALAGFELVPITAEVAVTAARLRASAGLRLPDALQAACALEIGAAALVTHDRDFSKVKGLKVLQGAASA